MKRLLSLLLVIVMICVVFVGCAKTEDQTEATPIKIGCLFPMSGNLSFFTDYFRPGVELYVQKVNDEGGINGRQVQLILKDDQADPSITTQRLNELKSEGVDVVSWTIHRHLCSRSG